MEATSVTPCHHNENISSYFHIIIVVYRLLLQRSEEKKAHLAVVARKLVLFRKAVVVGTEPKLALTSSS
jgi:hypothetical protein